MVCFSISLRKSLESLHPINTPLICHYLVQPKSYATAEQSSSQADCCEASDEQYEIFKKLTVDAGKPENMVEKITEGKMNSWYGESILIDQKLFTDNKITIKSLVDQISKISGKDCTFGTYLLFNIGKK